MEPSAQTENAAAATSEDGSVLVWTIDPERPAGMACARAGRNLQREWKTTGGTPYHKTREQWPAALDLLEELASTRKASADFLCARQPSAPSPGEEWHRTRHGVGVCLTERPLMSVLSRRVDDDDARRDQACPRGQGRGLMRSFRFKASSAQASTTARSCRRARHGKQIPSARGEPG